MSNSPLVEYTQISPNSSARTKKIDRVTIHHVAGVTSIKALAAVFQPGSGRSASSNYGIANDGTIGLFVDESRRAWTSNSMENDNRAITIEVSNSEKGGEWPVSEAAMESLIKLLVDICQRNPGIKRLNFTGDTSGNMTFHKWFAATGCPGPYLEKKHPWIAEEVNRRLDEAEKINKAPVEEKGEEEMRYNTLQEIPDYAKNTITKLVNAGILNGNGNGLNLSEDMIRILVLMERILTYEKA